MPNHQSVRILIITTPEEGLPEVTAEYCLTRVKLEEHREFQTVEDRFGEPHLIPTGEHTLKIEGHVLSKHQNGERKR